MTEEQLEQKCFEAYEKQCKKCFRSEPSYNDGYYDGYHECEKEHEWHDLEKDPTDLPKLDKTDMSDYVITDKGVAYYNGRVKSWYIQNEYILSDDVNAWCEIPTFDKE